MDTLVKLMLGIFVGLIVGIGVVLPVTNELTAKQTTTYTATNESLGTVASAPATIQTTNYPVVSLTEVIRLSNGTDTETLVRNANYTTISYPVGQFNVTTLMGLGGTVTAYADYNHRDTTYLESAAARTIISFLGTIITVVLFVSVATAL